MTSPDAEATVSRVMAAIEAVRLTPNLDEQFDVGFDEWRDGFRQGWLATKEAAERALTDSSSMEQAYRERLVAEWFGDPHAADLISRAMDDVWGKGSDQTPLGVRLAARIAILLDTPEGSEP